MKIYLVGGFVRDTVMGREAHDKDFVVVGATPEEMIEKGFHQVGADFPVFLDDAGQEYALARTERKTGKGYKGFETSFDPSVTLWDDLERRDLTINAMAQDIETGVIIDPFNGQKHIEEKRLVHVSDAFGEDPVRVLRTARFAAQLRDFKIDKSTIELMKNMVSNGEVDHLTRERVIGEVNKAMAADNPYHFFDTLAWIDALYSIFPGRVAKQIIDRYEMINSRFFTDDSLPLSVTQRWMEMFDRITSNTIRDLKSFGFSNEIIKVAEFCEAFTGSPSVWERCPSSRRALWEACKRCGQFRDQTLVAAFLEMRGMRFNADNVAEEVEVIAEAGEIGFDDLTEWQRENLKGPKIGAAIKQLQLEYLDKYMPVG
jgi:tRNA nucleotidyltransferase/poly(A) polymerase